MTGAVCGAPMRPGSFGVCVDCGKRAKAGLMPDAPKDVVVEAAGVAGGAIGLAGCDANTFVPAAFWCVGFAVDVA